MMGIDEVQEQIISEFSRHNDWFERYEHLIELGKQHTEAIVEIRTDEHALQGCQSQVWIRTEFQEGRLWFQADSDSSIIRGILTLLLRALSNRTPSEVVDAKLYFLEQIGLTTQLSPSRANGVAAIVRHLQRKAESILNGTLAQS